MQALAVGGEPGTSAYQALVWAGGVLALVMGEQGQVQAGLPMLSLLLSPLPQRSTRLLINLFLYIL